MCIFFSYLLVRTEWRFGGLLFWWNMPIMSTGQNEQKYTTAWKYFIYICFVCFFKHAIEIVNENIL